MMMQKPRSFLLGAFSLLNLLPDFSHAAPEEDRVHSLPGYGPPPTPQYSGFLDGTLGCDIQNGKFCRLHYWMAMAEEEAGPNPPTILWLNGGPGSTSIIGFLEENGPLLINATGGLMENPYSWTKVANLVALESPVGVGWSYCARQLERDEETGYNKLCINTDNNTASTARAGIVDFFTTKFPEFVNGGSGGSGGSSESRSDFIIAGESYAGVYIPTLAREILEWNKEAKKESSDSDSSKTIVPLVGLAVGDPCTDTVAQADSMDSLWYAHKNSLVMDAEFDFLWNSCGLRSPTLDSVGGKFVVESKIKRRFKAWREEKLREYASLKSTNGGLEDNSESLDSTGVESNNVLGKIGNFMSKTFSSLTAVSKTGGVQKINKGKSRDTTLESKLKKPPTKLTPQLRLKFLAELYPQLRAQLSIAAKNKDHSDSESNSNLYAETNRFNLIQSPSPPLNLNEDQESNPDSESDIDKKSRKCTASFRRFLASSSHGISQSWDPQWIMPYSLYSPAQQDVKEDGGMSNLMLSKEGLKALLHTEENIRAVSEATGKTPDNIDNDINANSDSESNPDRVKKTTMKPNWPMQPGGFDYTIQWSACTADYLDPNDHSKSLRPSMIDIYREIAPELEKVGGGVLVFNGDSDPCVSYEGTRTAITRVGFKEIEGGSYRPWFYNHTGVSENNVDNHGYSGNDIFIQKPPLYGPNLVSRKIGAQFGGEIVNYEHNLAFATVHGSGHMVPQFRPQAALHMITKVVKSVVSKSESPSDWNESFSPLMASNVTLETMNDDEFEKNLLDWTNKAKGSKYIDNIRSSGKFSDNDRDSESLLHSESIVL